MALLECAFLVILTTQLNWSD